MYNDEYFEYERIQNRTLRIERLKLISNFNIENENELYISKNITPPSTSNLKKIASTDYSKEYGDIINYIPEQCPICLEPIWRDISVVSCFYCEQIICLSCYKNINNDAANNNKTLLCPLCRGLLIDYRTLRCESIENNRENNRRSSSSSNNYNRILPTVSESEEQAILEQDQQRRIEYENDCRNFKRAVKTLFIILIAIIGFVILVIL